MKIKRKKAFGNRPLPVFMVCLTLFFAQPATAFDKPAQNEFAMGDVVVTATRSAKSTNELFADVEVVTGERLESTTATNLENALRGLPGLDNRGTDSQSWWYTTSIRGVDGGKRVLMMMDGVPLNSALTGFAYPLRTDLFAVEQIEVVKGSFSSLYGSNAMGGVINVISKQRKEEGYEGKVRAYGGDHGFFESGATLLGKKNKLSFNLDVARQELSNQYRRDKTLDYKYDRATGSFSKVYSPVTDAEYDTNKLFARMDYDVDGITSLTFTGNYAVSNSANGKTKYVDPGQRDLGDSTKDLYFLNLSGKTRIMDSLDLDMRIYTNYDKSESKREHIVSNPASGGTGGMGGMGGMRTMSSMPGMGDTGSTGGMGDMGDAPPFLFLFGDIEHWGRDTGVQVKGSGAVGLSHYLTGGMDFNYMEGYWKNTKEDGTVIDHTMDEEMNNIAFYLQDEINLTDTFIATLGCRYDINSESENSFSPKVGLFYRFNDRISFRGSLGRAFRAPNLNELFTPTWMMIPGVPFEANPDLDPEVIWSYDIGTTILVNRDMVFKLTGFYSKAEDLISNPIDKGVMKYENLDEVTTDGFEMGITGKMLGWMGYHLNGTYTHSCEKGEGRRGDVPLYQVNAGIQTRHSLGAGFSLSTSLDARYNDEIFYTDRMSGKTIDIDAYTLYDMAICLHYKENLKLKCAVYNLTDEEYEIHGSKLGPERYYWAGMEVTF
jgi:iron complex outermembrane receptor protein